jgi:hypothetical protein
MEIAEAISIFFLSTVKFMFAPGAAALAGFSLLQTILITSLGGMTGITVFYYFGRFIITKTESMLRQRHMVPKKVFTRRNKLIVKIKGKYGLIGLLVLTPSLLSIPIGSVVAAKFFYHYKLTYPLLLVATLVWSIILSILSHSVKSAIL